MIRRLSLIAAALLWALVALGSQAQEPALSFRVANLAMAPTSSSGGAFALVNHTVAQFSGANTVTTSAISMTGAKLIVLTTSEFASGATLCTPTDSSSNTYTGIVAQLFDSGANNTKLWYVLNPTVTSSMTFTCTGTNNFPAIAVEGFSDTGSGPTFDTAVGANSGTTAVASQQPGSITPAGNNEVLISGFMNPVETVPFTIDSGFTISDQENFSSGTDEGIAFAYQIQTTATARNPSWSWTGSPAVSGATQAAFKP
jgi:hypothetical protein